MTRPSIRPARRIGAGLAALAVAGVFLPTGSQAVAADDGDVDVINTETVQIYMDADGKVDTKRIYEQLSMTGNGTVDFGNPIESNGLRNLDGFEGFDVEDGEQQVEMDVDGVAHVRTVSDYPSDLPLDVNIDYKLDGKSVKAGDVVGEDGDLEVMYTVKNVTAKPQEITYPDGQGGMVTETVDVPVPMVGSLSTVLPSNFSEVKSGQANMAGDGKGGTKMSFTMTLVPPIGSDTATFGYTAKIKDGVIPRASISALPVNPLESPTFKTAATSYKGGAETGETLTAGATEIDSNLLKIRDGAGDLLAGLIQLSAGATALQDGLDNKAAPGAQKLADGTGDLQDGLGKLDEGAGKLNDGAGQLSDGASKLSGGTGDALTGSQQLNAGLKKISGGLEQLADNTTGLPKAKQGVNDLQDGVDLILDGFGSIDEAGTLINGLHKLETGSANLKGGLETLRGDGSAATPGLVAAKGGVDQIQKGADGSGGINAAVKPGGSLDTLLGGLESLKAFCDADPADPREAAACVPTVDALKAGVTTSKNDLTAANQGLINISAGIGNAILALNTQLIPGAGQLNTGLTDAKAGAIDLRNGVQLVSGGLDQLETGLISAVSGVVQLSNGAQTAETGSGDLASGLFRLDTGANQLAGGANQLADGAGQLSTGTGDALAGSTLIADGAQDLSTGLSDAADGSGLLAEGLQKATTSAPALPAGADRLSKEGMSKLIAAGKSTAKEYGQLYAIVGAGSERAKTESMAYGAPTQAEGLTAYSFEIQGEDGESSRNFKRALGALLVGGLGMGAFALRRRLI